jgi:hypothetical protein
VVGGGWWVVVKEEEEKEEEEKEEEAGGGGGGGGAFALPYCEGRWGTLGWIPVVVVGAVVTCTLKEHELIFFW